ncbi:phosphatase PAP2 family protein [Rossellomorea vietnamensis]|uniref:Phosphatase PAP2 family protein n=1 Tax=Rossellomorea aquimaris TaxID=189382 RepID=A0A5D4TKZ7_9BACI|nr:phosphatase PAP2 family protein [Rossellomorea aquimaris]TYS75461.1 phosphatase PAP2 family protein [Rossellomorea aquimaris]
MLKKTKANDLSKPVMALLIAGFLTVFTSAYLLVEISEGILESEKFTLDQTVNQWVAAINTSRLSNVMGYITYTGSVPWLTLGTFILTAYLFFKPEKTNWFITFLLINMFGISAITKGLKLLFQRGRPEELAQYDGTGFSFPSGHTTGAVTLYGFLIYLVVRSHLNKKLKWLVSTSLVIWVLTVAISRIFVEVHYFTDIIAGLVIGLLWLLVCIGCLEMLLHKKVKKK